jgi:hypothetical protein
MYILLFIFVALFGQGLAISIGDSSIPERLISIPNNEKKALSRFFEDIIFKSSFGYTLFGNKPISFTAYETNKGILQTSDYSFLILERGEELWKKYAIVFPSSNFVFKFQAYKGRHEIFLINRKAVLEIVTKHLDVFKKILGYEFVPEKLLQDLECPDTNILEVLHRHEGLFGILLGYGQNNAFAFQRKYDVIASLQNMLLHPLQLSQDQEAMLGENFLFFVTEKHSSIHEDNSKLSLTVYKNLFDEFLLLKKELRGSNENRNPLDFFHLPSFMVRADDPETLFLLEKYKNVRREMTYAYSQGNFLEVTLCKIATQ